MTLRTHHTPSLPPVRARYCDARLTTVRSRLTVRPDRTHIRSRGLRRYARENATLLRQDGILAEGRLP